MTQINDCKNIKELKIQFSKTKISLLTGLVIGLFITMVFSSCTPEPTPIPDLVTSEEYKVYHDLLVENPEMWNIPVGTETMIFFDQTFLRRDPDSTRSILGNNELISETLLTNFISANQIPYLLEDQFNLGIPVKFVSYKSIQHLVRGLEYAEQCEYSKNAVYPRPQFGGFYELSRVGFNEKLNMALLYIESGVCGGAGNFLILEKEEGLWIVKDFAIGLQSDLGLYMDDLLSPEEHAVYNSILNSSNEFISVDDYQYLTVFDQTGISDQFLLEEEKLFPFVATKLSNVTQDMFNNLIELNLEVKDFAPRFTTSTPIVLVSWQEYWKLGQNGDETNCLATIQERFPSSTFQGWFRFSRVGFNQDGDKALVYVDLYQCKSKDYLVYLEKEQGQWVLRNTVLLSSFPNANYFGRILFESNRDGNQEIYMINADGTDPVNLTNSTDIDFSPTWSPDRYSIAYNSGIGGNAEIFILDLENKQTTNITNNLAKDWEPDWSPDGSQIVFFTDRDGFSEIYTLQMDSLATQRLTNSEYYERQPTWSPDGSQIAFSSDQDGDWEIFLMDKDGKNVVNITNNEVFDLGPSWSPDGSMLAFASKLDDHWEIFSMEVNTRKVTRLTDNAANDLNPIWSPDGSKIAFQTDRDGNLEIYIMNVDGSDQVNITNHPANDYNPDW